MALDCCLPVRNSPFSSSSCSILLQMAERARGLSSCTRCPIQRCVNRRCACTNAGEPCSVECGCTTCHNPKGKIGTMKGPPPFDGAEPVGADATTTSTATSSTAKASSPRATRSKFDARLKEVKYPPPAEALIFILTDEHLISNVPNSTGDTPHGTTVWQVWFERSVQAKGYSPARFGTCCSSRCRKQASYGAHVQIAWKPDKIYIVPHCSFCNQYTLLSKTNTKTEAFAVRRYAPP